MTTSFSTALARIRWLLIYPATDADMKSASYSENAEGYLLTRDSMAWFWDHYVGDKYRSHTLASPGKATNMVGLPSATILTAEFDPLRDEGEAYAEKLRSAGVATFTKRCNGLVHGFISFTDDVPKAREAISLVATQLVLAFGD